MIDNKSFSEKNRLSYVTIRSVKENIINSKEPIYNPIVLMGLDKSIRYRIFWNIFNKEFNREYGGIYAYKSSDKIDLDIVRDKRLVIIENIELLNNNELLQNNIKELLSLCFNNNTQVVLCSDLEINDLEIDILLKSKLLSGLTLYLEK